MKFVMPETTKPKKKHRLFRAFLWFLGCNLLCLSLVFLAGVLFVRYRLNSLPDVDAQYLSTYETSKIVDSEGKVIWKPTDQRTTVLTSEEIPVFYKTALLSIEDKEFYESPGISVKGIANMVYGVIKSKIDPTVVPRGGSTIEQQLIKNKFYNGGKDYEVTTRKIQELFLAVEMDKNFTKEEILTFYVNSLEFAEGSTGLGAIMKTYFNKTPADYEIQTPETMAELAYLAGLSQAPTTYNLYEDKEAAESRKAQVLSSLLSDGLITSTEYNEALAFDLTTNLQERGWEGKKQAKANEKFKYYTDGVMAELSDMGYDMSSLSITVQTFLDQKQFETIRKQVQDPKYYLDDNQQVGVAVINTDGIVVGLVGSAHKGDEFNRAMSSQRSSGSSMKPFTAYGPLLQYFGDKYNTASLFDTSPYPYPGTNAVMYNYGGGVYGNQTMQKCLRYSYNTPVGRIDDEILGSVRMKTFLHNVGLDVKDSYSSVDGIGLNISPLQSAAAYNALNCGGVYTKPRFIEKLIFSDGSEKIVEPTRVQAMNPSVAYVLTQILRGVPGGDGTASHAAISQYAGYAGKTGSVKFDASVNAPKTYGDGGSDVWYCSYTNGGYAISVWCGYDVPNTSPRIPSYYMGQQEINRDLQILLNKDREVPDWEMPKGVKKLSGSGLSAQYAVTDAKDLGDTGIAFPYLGEEATQEVKQITYDTTVSDNWSETVESPWFSYYQNFGNTVDDIIDQDIYDQLAGKEKNR